MVRPDTNHDPVALGLSALVWTLGEPARADRLLALTGLRPVDLRERAGEAGVLAAILRFLESHEPDLVACAAAIGVPPIALVRAAHALDGTEMGA